MQDLYTLLSTIRRPRLLLSAARHGLAFYDRNRHLRRLFPGESLPSPGAAAVKLMDMESGHNEARRAGSAAYSVAQHVDVLVALMGEAQLLRAAMRPAPV